MEDSFTPLPWDYFLTNYEQMCLTETASEVKKIFPRMSMQEIEKDIARMKEDYGDSAYFRSPN